MASCLPAPPTLAPEPAGRAAEAPRVRLDFLDGLRGLSALYVFLFHMLSLQMGTLLSRDAGTAERAGRILSWLRYGPYAVDVFIILSGYCLMLPVVQSAEGQLRGGVRDYLKRRARRILPPYYAALFLSCLLLLLWNRLQPGQGPSLEDESWRMGFTPGNLLAHLLLIHNWRFGWVGSFDPPMWSVAMEWQIYFLFPLLLLPLWRRFGSPAAILSGFLVGLAPHFLLPKSLNLDWTCPWYLGLFALGMAAADLSFSRQTAAVRWKARVPWGVILLLLLLVCGLRIQHAFPGRWVANTWQTDPLIGVIAACLLLYGAQLAGQSEGKRRPLFLRLLESRWAVALGVISYSLYLAHFPLMAALDWILMRQHLPTRVYLAVFWGLGVPLVLGLTYLFHLAFERPFLPLHYRRELQRLQSPSRESKD